MADIVTSRVFTDGERGITAAKLNDIVGSSVIQPAFYSAKPVSSTLVAGDKLLALKSTGSYAQSDFQNVIDSVAAGINSDAEIWSVRLRSFNAAGNPNFEVDQRMSGTSNMQPGSWALDRWNYGRNGLTTMQTFLGPTVTPINLPGTSYQITRQVLNITLQAQQASLAATDISSTTQNVEGPYFRELAGDVHSISLLVQSTVANLKFSVALRDPGSTRSLVKLCTIPTAGIWTLIQLPNLPAFPAAGNFSTAPGAAGYNLSITFAAGATFIAPAADTWQTGNFVGAPGMSNFGAQPVNSQLAIAFVQHEPGPVCSTLMDKPFTQNLDECLRYYTKSYSYAVKGGTVTDAGAISGLAMASQHPSIYTVFKKPMAKVPTVVPYSNVTGASSNVRDVIAGADRSANSVITLGETGYGGFTVTATNASQTIYQWQYIADTGW